MTKKNYSIIWGFRANNPLDWIEKDLFSRDGLPVKISLHGNFVITVNGERMLSTDNNASVCYWLNLYGVGVLEEE